MHRLRIKILDSLPLYSKAKWEKVINDVKSIHDEIKDMKNDGKSVNSMWKFFQCNLETSKKKKPTYRIKTAKNKDSCPWINKDLKRLVRKRDRCYKRKKKSGNKADKEKYQLKAKTGNTETTKESILAVYRRHYNSRN